MQRMPYVERATGGSCHRPIAVGRATAAAVVAGVSAGGALLATRGRAIGRLRVGAIVTVAVLALAACGANPSPTASPTATPGPPKSPASSDAPNDGRIVLDRAPAGLACDAIGVEYRSVTFFIDPTAQPQVWVVTDRGSHLSVRWGPSFVGGPAADPSVLDATGAVVARPREVLVIPQGAWPSLHGHFVCPSPTAIYILDEAAPR